MTEASQAVRANRRGDPCPPWCVTDHDEVLVAASEHGPAIYRTAHGGPKHEIGAALVTVRALQLADDKIIVFAQAGHGVAEAPVVRGARDVEDLAKFVDSLARLTHEQCHELADAIRAAGKDAES